MLKHEAEQMIASGMTTFGLLQSLLANGDSNETSTSCSLFSKTRVKRMVLTAIHGKRGVIEEGSDYADYALWTLVEFG